MRARSVRVNARTAQNQRAAEQSEDSRESFLVLRKDLWEDHRSLCQEWRFGICDGLDEPTLSGLQSRLSTENAQSCESSSESHGLSVSRLRPATCLRIPLSLTCFSMRLLRPLGLSGFPIVRSSVASGWSCRRGGGHLERAVLSSLLL